MSACAQVTWEPPEDDHGAPVSGYTLECSLVRMRGRDVSPMWHTVYSGADVTCLVSLSQHSTCSSTYTHRACCTSRLCARHRIKK